MEVLTLKINTENTDLLMDILNSLNFVHEVQIVASPLSVLPDEMEQQERKDWQELSLQGLAGAYGTDEPDYEHIIIKQ